MNLQCGQELEADENAFFGVDVELGLLELEQVGAVCADEEGFAVWIRVCV